jgi:hypothetical protein
LGKSLVAMDTDHIKQYVFATDKLKEIRGASSILDRLNREKWIVSSTKWTLTPKQSMLMVVLDSFS